MNRVTVALADAQLTGVENWGTVILGGAASLAVLGFLALLLVRGFWAKMGEPAVKATFKEWYTAPDATEARKAFIREVVDNEIRRDDGLIHREIKKQVGSMEERLLEAIIDLKEMIQVDRAYKEQVLQELNLIKGAMRVITKEGDQVPPPVVPVPHLPQRPPAVAPRQRQHTPYPGDTGKFKPVK